MTFKDHHNNRCKVWRGDDDDDDNNKGDNDNNNDNEKDGDDDELPVESLRLGDLLVWITRLSTAPLKTMIIILIITDIILIIIMMTITIIETWSSSGIASRFHSFSVSQHLPPSRKIMMVMMIMILMMIMMIMTKVAMMMNTC